MESRHGGRSERERRRHRERDREFGALLANRDHSPEDYHRWAEAWIALGGRDPRVRPWSGDVVAKWRRHGRVEAHVRWVGPRADYAPDVHVIEFVVRWVYDDGRKDSWSERRTIMDVGFTPGLFTWVDDALGEGEALVLRIDGAPPK